MLTDLYHSPNPLYLFTSMTLPSHSPHCYDLNTATLRLSPKLLGYDHSLVKLLLASCPGCSTY